ncbi:MAG: DNA polymerase III subunit gamma/tau [Candidatus Omnitrophica bacterium]|nr:DNA polymerase III subunit gamma/tau [Candidatus Omnitrophota bacterium]
MTHQPFARKYRPQTFDDLIGQPHITATLTKALAAKRLGQAYLFTGQRGVGKTSAARILAKCLNCEQGPTATPCNRCANCTQITAGNSLDVLEIDGASNRGIDEIRNLRESVPFAPTGGAFRVYIIDEVHMLTAEAFNALLKTLEEPPAHVKFIFATTAPHKVPATVLSRCQRFDFRRIESSVIVKALARVAKAEKIHADEPALYAIARAADGSLRDAEVVFEQLASFVSGAVTEADVTALVGTVESETLWALSQAILDHAVPKALAALQGQFEQGKDASQLLAGLLRHLRNLLIVASTRQAPGREALLLRLIDEPADYLKRLADQMQSSSEPELLMCLQVLSGAYDLIRRSPMAQTILELVVIKLASREQWQSLSEISRRLEQLGALPPPSSTTPASPPARSVQASQPQEPVPTPPRPEALAAQWPVFLERLGAQKMSLAAYLAEARPLHLEEGLLTIGLPAFALHQEVLTVLEHRRLIERLWAELCQAPITVQYATLPEPIAAQSSSEPPAAEPSSAPPIVQDIVKLFNATILDQPPRTA